MTLSSELLQELVDGQGKAVANQQTIIKTLLGWGKPNGVAGPRQRERVQLRMKPDEISRTQQSFAKECDINNIMAKFRKGGELTHLAKHDPQYGDFTTELDYQTACNRVLDAQADFGALSAEIRKRMDNDPAKFLAFMADPENLEEARELGLVDPAPPLAEPDPGPKGAAASGGDPPPIPPKPSPIEGGE